MSDLYQRVTADQDIFKRLASKIPGFAGYIERQNRRAADKLVRETVANRFEEQWQRISAVQRDLISGGGLAYVDDLEAAALKLRQFIDRVRRASYGDTGFFDAVKVNSADLAAVYQYDEAMLSQADDVGHGIDNVEASLGTDGLPAAIRNLVALAGRCIETFERRSELMKGGLPAGPNPEVGA